MKTHKATELVTVFINHKHLPDVMPNQSKSMFSPPALVCVFVRFFSAASPKQHMRTIPVRQPNSVPWARLSEGAPLPSQGAHEPSRVPCSIFCQTESFLTWFKERQRSSSLVSFMFHLPCSVLKVQMLVSFIFSTINENNSNHLVLWSQCLSHFFSLLTLKFASIRQCWNPCSMALQHPVPSKTCSTDPPLQKDLKVKWSGPELPFWKL
jgi:hypothetical protein